MFVYVVDHAREKENGEEDIKLIGVYSTLDKANEAVARTLLLPGFSENPDGFTVDKYRVDEDHWEEGFGV